MLNLMFPFSCKNKFDVTVFDVPVFDVNVLSRTFYFFRSSLKSGRDLHFANKRNVIAFAQFAQTTFYTRRTLSQMVVIFQV